MNRTPMLPRELSENVERDARRTLELDSDLRSGCGRESKRATVKCRPRISETHRITAPSLEMQYSRERETTFTQQD